MTNDNKACKASLPIPKILLLYKAMIPSVLLCGHCQLEYLAAEGLVNYRHKTLLQVTNNDLNWPDIVFLSRLDSPTEYQLARLLKKAGKTLIYMLDDDLLNVPVTIISSKYYRQKKISASIQQMLAMCDVLLSPSPLLLKKYAHRNCQTILLEEPAISPIPYQPRDPSAPIKIGFAGSADRHNDVDQILKAPLLRLHKEYGRQLEFIFFGITPSFATELNARCIPYSSSYDYYRNMLDALHLDIGLAPMPDDSFHACKHYNKFIEYAAVGAVGVFSDVQPYCCLKDKFDWQLLCSNTPDSWYNSLKDLIDHPNKLERYKKKAVQLAHTVLSVPTVAVDLQKALHSLTINPQQNKVKIHSLYWLKVKSFIMRACNKIKRCIC